MGGRGVGSSPLARGLRRRATGLGDYLGIIPARAGFTPGPGPRGVGGWDHPRSRGVYTVLPLPGSRWCGSSPLARGLRTGRRPGGVGPGIIPARAGFTDLRVRGAIPSWDHPRSRGVYIVRSQVDLLAQGSSPLARGLHPTADPKTEASGIIPARAGFTAIATLVDWSLPDHPRSRGVYVEANEETFSAGGSSPLARGLP